MKYNQNSRDKIYDDRYEYDDSYSQTNDAVDSEIDSSYTEDDGYEYNEFKPRKKKSGNLIKKRKIFLWFQFRVTHISRSTMIHFPK